MPTARPALLSSVGGGCDYLHMTTPKPGRDAAHIFLDSVAAWDDADPDQSVASANLALERFNEVGAVTGVINDDDGGLTLDVSDLHGGAMLTIHWLLSRLSDATGRDRLELIADARQFIDSGAVFDEVAP